MDKPEEVFEDECNVLLNATGVLNKWKWPEIAGRETFKGPMMHSANWDDSVEFKDKTVAVIGAGSSGIQIVPALQPIVKNLKSFIRSTTWITAGFGQRFAAPGGTNFKCEHSSSLSTEPGADHFSSCRHRRTEANLP